MLLSGVVQLYIFRYSRIDIHRQTTVGRDLPVQKTKASYNTSSVHAVHRGAMDGSGKMAPLLQSLVSILRCSVVQAMQVRPNTVLLHVFVASS